MWLSIELLDCCSLSRSPSECKHCGHWGEAEAASLQMKGRLAWFSMDYASRESEQIRYSAAVPFKTGDGKPPRVSVATGDVINSVKLVKIGKWKESFSILC